jgi:hypothetical protein
LGYVAVAGWSFAVTSRLFFSPAAQLRTTVTGVDSPSLASEFVVIRKRVPFAVHGRKKGRVSGLMAHTPTLLLLAYFESAAACCLVQGQATVGSFNAVLFREPIAQHCGTQQKALGLRRGLMLI